MVYSDFFITKNAYLDINVIVYIRIILSLFIISTIYILHKDFDFQTIEYNVFIFFILLAISNFVGHYTFPIPERNIYTLEIIATLLIYLIFPVNIRYQVIGGVLFALSNGISLNAEVQNVKIYYQTIIMLINCNIIGFFISRYYQRSMRQLFYAYSQEEGIQLELTKRLEELRYIGGAVPICNTCYSIRGDDGYWDNLEHYVSGHSEAHFTHSICPECTEKMLKELDEEDQNPKKKK